MVAKISLEDARNEFIKRGHEPLFDNYNNAREKLPYKCKCGNESICQITLANLKQRYDNCKKCTLKKQKENSLNKHGVEHPQQSEKLKNKKKLSNLKKYGVEHVLQSNEIKGKIKKTNLERYGTENPFQSNKVKEKTKKTNLQKYGTEYSTQSKEIKEKMKQTHLQKYGVEYAMQNKEIKEKAKKTNLEKYGDETPLLSEEIKEKTKKTNLKKYGTEIASQSNEVKEKMKKSNLQKYGTVCILNSDRVKQANLEKYGTEYAMQNKEILEKQQNSSFTLKEFTFPELNQTIKVQGYEPQCLNDLLQNEHIDEQDLLDGHNSRPTIKYTHNNKTHYYHPDIYIPSKNMIIEVKSTYTYKSNEAINILKLEATKNAGYNAEIRIYDRKGICIEKIE
jgi:hypothetical protein